MTQQPEVIHQSHVDSFLSNDLTTRCRSFRFTTLLSDSIFIYSSSRFFPIEEEKSFNRPTKPWMLCTFTQLNLNLISTTCWLWLLITFILMCLGKWINVNFCYWVQSGDFPETENKFNTSQRWVESRLMCHRKQLRLRSVFRLSDEVDSWTL